MTTGRVATRRTMLELEHAMNTARQVKDSHLGEVLLRDNAAEQRLLSSQLTRLNSEIRRQEAHFQQQRAKFLKKTSELPEPVLIVERHPSPQQLKKALYAQAGIGEDGRGHSYMRPTISRARTPNTMPTIEAFTVQPRRKQNIWEEAALPEKPRFHSTVMPSAPLSRYEERELQRGWALHMKPGSDATDNLQLIRTHEQATPRQQRHRRAQLTFPESTALSTTNNLSATLGGTATPRQLEKSRIPAFITQIEGRDLEDLHVDSDTDAATPREDNVKSGRKVTFIPQISDMDKEENKHSAVHRSKRKSTKGKLRPLKSKHVGGQLVRSRTPKRQSKQPLSPFSRSKETIQQDGLDTNEPTHNNGTETVGKGQKNRSRKNKPKTKRLLEILTESPPP